MTITFTIPDPIEERLRAQVGDLNLAAKEAALVELFRQRRLSHGELAQSLEISRDGVDALLARHGVTEDLLSLEEFAEQAATLRDLLNK